MFNIKSVIAFGLFATANTLRSTFRSASINKHYVNHVTQSKCTMVSTDTNSDANQDVFYDSIALTGFISKFSNFAEPYAFTRLFEKNKWKSITAVSDDDNFAKKRLTNPKNVYSGLIDIMEYHKVAADDLHNFESVLANKDVWLAFNVSTSLVNDYAKLAASSNLKRFVMAVNLTADESNQEDLIFPEAQSILIESGVKYTILKYSQMRDMQESKYPYRIVRGEKTLPNEIPLSDQDLMRVLTEVVDIPKTFNLVYGIGGGSRLDAEILIYMKSQGWPERVQVGLLMGDMMDTIEKKFEEEQKNKSKLAVVNDAKPVQVTNLI